MQKLFLLLILTCLLSLTACKNEQKHSSYKSIPASKLSGQELAALHCASCHVFVAPEVLPKASWQFDVLPAMGNRLGIFSGEHQPDSIFGSPKNKILVKKANVFPENPLLAKSDWEKIVAYYLQNAPEHLTATKPNLSIKKTLKHFKYYKSNLTNKPPFTVMVKILEDEKKLIFSDSKRNKNSLVFLNSDLEKVHSLQFKNAPIHYQKQKNNDSVFLTTIGRNIYPNDLSHGAVSNLSFNENGEVVHNQKVAMISQLQRPVNMAYGDINGDGLEDIVVCEYGDLTGKLVWYKNMGNTTYQAYILKRAPGAIKTIIKDYNNDGLNDIFVLMAQGNEGVFYFENNGDGTFNEDQLLSFSPLNGSQSFELVDFNNDGFDDILYVCGDNADKTPILKEYHGVYIFLNDGNLNYIQTYFYHQNGAYKAIPNDYDLDGDIDIAAISYFPNYLNSPEESFVYLENNGELKFEASTFAESSNGRWIVMDAGDIDGDGDIDIALGSNVQFLAKGDTTGLSKKWLTESPSVIILENTIK